MKKNILCLCPIWSILLISIVSFTSCENNQKEDKTSVVEEATISKPSFEIKPSGEKPSWAPDITPEMQAVIEKLASFKTPPLQTLTPQKARKAPTPTDAVMALMKEKNISMPVSKVDTMGKDIQVKGGKIHLRIYTPKGNSPLPVIVYYHGGGWVIADLDTYDASARALAEQTGAILVSVAYRQGPENKFPTAHNDSYAAYEWVLKNAETIQGDSKRIAVAGESAGGNLAASVSMMARDNGIAMPIHQLLVYPIAGYNLNTPSYQKYASAKPLNKSLMQWFFDNYLPNKSAGNSPMISLVKADLKRMPHTTIISAELDPLQSEGQMLADKLKAAGIPVTLKIYKGVTHEFFGMAAVLPEAKEAEALASSELKKAFSKKISQK